MTEQAIVCPKCKTKIPLTETLSAQIEEKVKSQLDEDNRKILDEITKEKEDLNKEKKKVESDKQSIEDEVKKRTDEERSKLEEEREGLKNKIAHEVEKEKGELIKKAEQKIQEDVALKLKDLENQNKEQGEKLEKAEQKELELRKKMRDVEVQKKNLDLELQRKMDEEREKITEEVKKEADESHRMKLLEKEKQMEQMRKTIEDLKRKSEQGSMQIQGDVQENELMQMIKNNFPIDIIEDVPTGIRGGDLIQTVNSQFGIKCGKVLWESKNTKNWSNDWLKKAKEDQGIAKADVCILVSRIMPEGVNYFANVDGVWVCEYTHALPLISALRLALYDVFQVKQSSLGKNEKMEMLYEYLAGSQFKNRIENIVLAFTGMKSDLDSEKRAIQRIWKKREQEIERVVSNTAGMYGDLQGIIGASALPEVKSLTLPEGVIEE
ncbi:MAG: hypothetical protein ACD_7C00020G0021 [uncultured bacterium]|nr:MAG: hypothetical protein ACD_7C00020G0021 [uncultured bacterium]HBR79842.1 DUF2130 domain-containing protein [Candidatus Moranbacteria bacterium]